ncbi:MAG: hypothetical protein R3F17_12775 [Planctomycetota bacterium]
MNLLVHGGLFLLASAIIVLISCFFAESDDRRAFRIYPKRLLRFLGGCGLVVAIMLVIEHTFASIH